MCGHTHTHTRAHINVDDSRFPVLLYSPVPEMGLQTIIKNKPVYD